MDIISLMEERVSTRSFSEEILPKEDLMKILKACDLAPTGKNRKPLYFLILSDAQKMERLFTLVPSAVAKFYHAPAILFSIRRTEDHLAELDCGAAIQNGLLAATSLGIGSCWIHCARADFGTPEGKKAVKEVLGIGENEEVMEMIALGYPSSGSFEKKVRGDNGSRIL